jgi:hypothetical protein
MQGYLMEMGKGGASAQRAVESLQAAVTGKAVSLDRQVHTEQYSAPKANSQPGPDEGHHLEGVRHRDGGPARQHSRLSFDAREQREQELREARRIGRANGLP